MVNKDVRYTKEPAVRRCCVAVPHECKGIAEYEFRLDEGTSFYYCTKHRNYYVDDNESLTPSFKPIEHTLGELATLQAEANEHASNLLDTMKDQTHIVDTVTGILQQRGSVYGNIRCNMNCQKELVAVIRNWFNSHQTGEDRIKLCLRDQVAWQGCLEMIMHKVARMITGDITYEDNYNDICGYAKLMNDIVQPYREPKYDTVRVD